MLSALINYEFSNIIGILFTFLLTFFLMDVLRDKLPHDQGRAFAVEGALSKGKARGAGIIFILVFALADLLFISFNLERFIYLIAILFSMFTGYFDDASEKPWNEYIKGTLDLVLSIVIAINYLYFNGNSFTIGILGNRTVTLPAWLFGILIVALVWVAINVTNCTDGVDGLCGVLSIITIGSFYLLAGRIGNINDYSYTEVFAIVAIAAYLWYNANPSSMLMGDAGSRALGVIIAIAALKSGSPLLYIPFSIVMILDGGLGLIKVALLRFLKIKILVNVRCPLHDHARKNANWSNTQVDYRFAIIQLAVSLFFSWCYIYMN